MSEGSSGLMGSVKRLTSTLISIVATRLELLANELQAERLHLVQMAVLSLLALFSFGMGLLLLTALIVVLFWDYRITVLAGLCVLFFALGSAMMLLLRNKVSAKPKLFSASIAELTKDKDHLGEGHE